MMRRTSWTAVLLLFIVPLASGLFEDQAGSFDWYKQLVGHVTDAALHKIKPKLFLGTQRNIVGSLNLRDGSIAWRKLLADGDQLNGVYMLENPAVLLSTSSSGTFLRAWDQNDGSLLWELYTPPLTKDDSIARSNPPLIVTTANSDSQQIVTLINNELKVIDAASGSVVETKELHGNFSTHTALLQQMEDTTVVFQFMPESSEIAISAIEGQLLQESTVTTTLPVSAQAAVGPAGLAILSADPSSVCVVTKAGDSDTFSSSCHALSALGAQLSGSHIRLIATSNGFVLVSNSKDAPGAALLAVKDGGLSLIHFFQHALAASTPVTIDGTEAVGLLEQSEGESLIDAAHLNAGSVTVKVVATSSGKVLSEDTVQHAVPGLAAPGRKAYLAPGSKVPSVESLYLGTYKRKDRRDGYRSLLVWKDQHVSLLQQGQVVWERDEALSGVSEALFVDLPAPAKGAATAPAAASPQQSNFNNFLKAQLLNFKVQFKINTPEEASELSALRTALSDKNKPTRDPNGFRRLIIALTEAGRLVAIHNGDGHVVWSHDLRANGAPLAQRLLPWRSFHDLTHAPQVAVLHSAPGMPPHVTIIDAHMGRKLEQLQLQGQGDLVVAVHQHLLDGAAEQSVYMLVDVTGGEDGTTASAQLLPDSKLTRDWFANHYRSLYFWHLDQQQGSLKGFGFDRQSAAAASHGSTSIPAVSAWQMAFSSPVLGVAARDATEPVQTSVKVLGDRSIKYKYLNPNTVLVVTGATPGQQLEPDAADFLALTVYVVDTVTGRVLHSQTHPGGRGPMQALVLEHLVVYTFFDTFSTRHVTISMELYDATPREFSVLDYLFNPNSTQPISSYQPAPLEVPSLSFYSRFVPKLLTATRTEKGITSKQLLIGTATDQVYAMDTRFVDPRRPKRAKPTPEEVEERLIPYNEYLPLQPHGFATYDKQVFGLRGVVAAPSRLESTCLMFAYGIDLFYTRLAPARAYDSLDDDFAYGLLVVALVGLFTAAVVMSQWTKSKMLADKWQ